MRDASNRASTGRGKERYTSRLGSIRLRGSERRDWSRDGCIVSCRRCSADWLHPASVDCTLRFRRVSNRGDIQSRRRRPLPRRRVVFFYLPLFRFLRNLSFLNPLFFIFSTPLHSSPSTLPPLLAIDRQKSHGGIVKARREGTARLAPWIYPPQTRTFFRELPTKRRVFKVLGSNTANVC